MAKNSDVKSPIGAVLPGAKPSGEDAGADADPPHYLDARGHTLEPAVGKSKPDVNELVSARFPAPVIVEAPEPKAKRGKRGGK